MLIKTLSGICISVDGSGFSKLLLFDRPVRTIELTKGESLRVASLLADSIDAETTTNVKVEKRTKHPPNHSIVRVSGR